MVKNSKKSKSKRVSLKKKYKVIRKVKEHHKKKAKEAKKIGSNHKNKVEKDPCIPSKWPFKDQEIKAFEVQRARRIGQVEQRKPATKERATKRKLGLLDSNAASEVANERQNVGEDNDTGKSIGINKKRDNSDRTFYQGLGKVIEASDVILEVLDARDPLGTRCVDMENLVMRSGPRKNLVLLLNKIDLVPCDAVEKWLKYLRDELPAIAFKCNTQEQKSNLSWKSTKASKLNKSFLQTSDCLGAEALLKLLNNYARSHEIKKSITVGVIGLPNVGKSSLINSLKRCHVVKVGATPGLTRSMQEIQLDKNIRLLDCPGVVMLKSGNDASIALRNCKKIEKLEDPVGPVREILKLCPASKLVALYKIPSFDSVDNFLQKVAKTRGKLKKGGVGDVEAAARIVLRDWNEGKISYYTMPPTRNQGEILEAQILSEFSKEFNVDEVYSSESSFIGSLKPVDSFHHVEVPPSCPLNFDEKMLEDDMQPQPLSQCGREADKMIDDSDEPMKGEEDDAGKVKAKSDSSRQNEKLYAVEGMLNTRLNRAEKKRRGKANKLWGTGDAMDADYDFTVDYNRSESAIGNGSESAEDDDDDGNDEIVAGVPVSS